MPFLHDNCLCFSCGRERVETRRRLWRQDVAFVVVDDGDGGGGGGGVPVAVGVGVVIGSCFCGVLVGVGVGVG